MAQESKKYKIFVSSTMTDLQNERNVIADVILDLKQIPIRVETNSSEPTSPRNVIIDLIHTSDILLGVYGARYGYIPKDESISVTEMEFNIAKEAGKDILIYVQDAQNRESKAEKFLQRIQDFDSGLFRRPYFTNINQLESWVRDDILELIGGNKFHIFTFKEYAKKIEDWTTKYESKWGGIYTELSTIPTNSSKFTSNEENKPHGSLSLSHVIDNNQIVIITGDAGAGKTTALLNAIRKEANLVLRGERTKVPVFVSLNMWTEQHSIPSLILASLAFLGKQISLQLLDTFLSEGRFFLAFDGINEIPYAHRSNGAEKKLVNFIKKYSQNHILVTSRSAGFNATIFKEFPIYQIQPLNKEGILHLIKTRVGSEIGEALFRKLGGEESSQWYKSYSLINLARNPFYLWMITEVYLTVDELPRDRGLLLKSFIQYIFQIRDMNKASDFDGTIKNLLLSQLAYEMFESGEIVRTTKEDVLNSFSKTSNVLKEKGMLEKDATVVNIFNEIQSNGLLTLEDNGATKWSHQLFQDFFGGSELARRFDSNIGIWRQLNKTDWKDSVVLATSLTRKSEQYVNEVLNGKKGLIVKIFHENPRLVLAIDCVNNTYLWDNKVFREKIIKDAQYRLNNNINQRFKKNSEIFFKWFGKFLSPFLLKLEKTSINNRSNLEPLLWCLGEIRDPNLVKIFEKYLKHEDRGIRWVAADALRKLGISSSLETLIEALDDYDGDVRWVVIQAIISISDSRASSALVSLLDHPDPTTRRAATFALGKIGGEDNLVNLEMLRESDDTFVWWGESISQTAYNAMIEISDRVSINKMKLKDH